MKFFQDFRSGVLAPFQGVRFLFQHASLVRLALIPFLINLLLFIALGSLLYAKFGYFLSLIITRPDQWYWLILYYVVTALALVLILVVGTFALCLIGNIIAAPFHEWMCEKTKEILVGKSTPSSLPLWQEAKRILSTQFKKLLLLLILEIFILLLVLIPGIGAFLSGALTLILLAFQFLDFPLGAERLALSSQFKNFLIHPLAWLGFGCGLSLMLAIPLLNIAVLPSGVIGACLLYYQRLKN